jgi:ABC-type antimicrobial peptide transport system permease subunit
MALEPRVQIRVAPLSDNLTRLLDEPRLNAFLADALGLLALALAAFGVFSAFAYSVEQRKAELGIRMALGARQSHIVATVIGSSGHALLAGLIAGVAGAAASGRVIRVFLFGSSPFDPAAYAAVAAILIAAALLATVHPARRAARIDPVNALRCE